jgi:hypothetical protein
MEKKAQAASAKLSLLRQGEQNEESKLIAPLLKRLAALQASALVKVQRPPSSATPAPVAKHSDVFLMLGGWHATLTRLLKSREEVETGTSAQQASEMPAGVVRAVDGMPSKGLKQMLRSSFSLKNVDLCKQNTCKSYNQLADALRVMEAAFPWALTKWTFAAKGGARTQQQDAAKRVRSAA